MSKKEKLVEIVELIQELYPELDTLLVTDFENPDSIIIASTERVIEIAKEHGIDLTGVEPEEYGYEDDDLFSQYSKKLGYDEGDDGNGGLLQ